MLLGRKRAKEAKVRVTSKTLNLALLEFSPEWEMTSMNLSRLDMLVEHLFRYCYSGDIPDGSEGGRIPVPDIMVLPEFFSTGFTMNPQVAERPDSSPSLVWMERTAGLYDCAVAGSIPVVMPDGRRFNRFYFVTPSGVAGQYDKRHLFLGGEDINYVPGTEQTVIEYKGWRIMPGICFDLRFPVWMRNIKGNPYDLYLNVANWPSVRKKVAQVLVEARAIENVCYVAFCNRSGKDMMLEYAGGSAIVNHRGRSRESMLEIDGTNVIYASLDMAEMLRYRASFPILQAAD